jgi:sulfide:quinone oxidoreductase
VYAVGDVTSVGTPKAGVFSERQAMVVADRIIARVRGEQESAEFAGAGICYLEFGGGQVAVVEAIFEPGQAPHGNYTPPSDALMAEKHAFGTSRVQRWFDRAWP